MCSAVSGVAKSRQIDRVMYTPWVMLHLRFSRGILAFKPSPCYNVIGILPIARNFQLTEIISFIVKFNINKYPLLFLKHLNED